MWIEPVTFVSTDYYNFGDLNRVNNNIQYIYDELIALGYTITLLETVVTNYTRTDFPTVTNVNKAKSNILAIIDGFYPVDAPVIVVNTDEVQEFDYVEANKLELNLQALYDFLQNLLLSLRYSGTFYSGDNAIVIYT